MRKIWKTVTGSLAVFLVVALIFAGGFFTGRYYGNKAEIMEETMVFGLTSGNAAMMLLKLLETAMTPIIRIAHM